MDTNQKRIMQLVTISVIAALGVFGGMTQTHADESLATRQSLTELSREGKHFEVMTRVSQLAASDLNIAQKLAIGRSAWALGLANEARAYWDQVLADRDFTGPERFRTILARAILELQEENYDIARSFAEQALMHLEPSDLRAQFNLVIAESYREQGVYGRAEKYYHQAEAEGSDSVQEEASFLLGETHVKLGLLDKARYNFAATETMSPYARRALIRLAEIDFRQRDFEGVLTWLAEGIQHFNEEFDEPRVYYMQTVALVELGREKDARESLSKFAKRFTNNGSWFALANAAVESSFARSLARARLQESSDAN